LSFFIQRNLASKFSANANTFLKYEKIAILENLGDALRSYNKYSKKTPGELKILEDISKLLEAIRAFESKNDNLLLQKLRDNLETLKNKTKVNEKKPVISEVLIRPLVNIVADLYENLVAENIKKLALKKD
jgi:hypothetical protein